MRGDVGHGRPAQAGGDIVPAELTASMVLLGVETVASGVGHIDPADERQLTVDDHRLLVMAVEGMLAWIAVGLDPGPAAQIRERRS